MKELVLSFGEAKTNFNSFSQIFIRAIHLSSMYEVNNDASTVLFTFWVGITLINSIMCPTNYSIWHINTNFLKHYLIMNWHFHCFWQWPDLLEDKVLYHIVQHYQDYVAYLNLDALAPLCDSEAFVYQPQAFLFSHSASLILC